MTKDQCQKKLKKSGYSITVSMNLTFIAKKNQSIYTAKSLNGLVSKIFGKWVDLKN